MSMEKFIKPFPLSDIKTPRNGAEILLDNYWLTKDGMYFKSKRGGTHQCNRDKRIVDRVYADLLASGYECTYIPVAYIERGKS
ncbi:hypothetical protein [Enterobacter cloacae]|uniref:hypothetical protein n=1 Tax=Enterobacter cloacae TaxID=550 RepID=UPI00292E43D3|nr:hypothetical protein [Enterobacter cloacae]